MKTLPFIPSEEEMAHFCKRHHICHLSLFGSVIRDDFHPDSDIDILVEFSPAHIPGFFKLASIERELSDLFEGKTIDLRTLQDLSRYFRDDVLKIAEPLYAEA